MLQGSAKIRRESPVQTGPYRSFFDGWGVYIAVSFVALLPCLVMGYVFFDDDLFDYYGISRLFAQNSIFNGHLPFWNPYLFAGQPFMANPATMALYPLYYLTLLFPSPYGAGIFYFLHLVIAGAGMHFWLKNLGLSRESCWIGSLSFMFSGFFWCEIIHPNVLSSLVWIPWVLGSLERFLREAKPSNAFLCGLAFAAHILASSVETSLGTAYLMVFYV